MRFAIESVQGKQSWKDFVDLPYQLYRGHPYWVPPLRVAQKELFDVHKHPFYAHAEIQCFLARREGKPCGRVAAIFDRNFNAFHAEMVMGFFGFFESIDDIEVASALIESARKWLQQRGARVIRGPVNPSTNYECGMLLEGYDLSPNIMMPYNPPTYPKLLETAGLRKSKDLLAYYKPIGQPRENASTRAAGGTQRVTIRPIRMQSFDEDVEIVWNLYNSSWERNWGFVPMTHEEFLHEVAQTKPIIRADLVLIGECAGRPVGFALALPNINIALKHIGGKLFPFGQLKILYYLRSIKELRLVALGVMEEFRSTYMAADLYAALIRNAARLGFEHCEMSWILEDNLAATRSLEAMGARPYKKYRLFEWDLRDCPPGSVVRAK